MRTPNIAHPKVFISYAWTSEAYVNKVATFAAELQQIGIEVLFDKFEMKPGNELNKFMERSVNDSTVTNVLLLLNKTYAEKANNREGGVGKETQIISEEIYNKTTQTKFIPVIFEKGENGEVYKPTYLGSTYFVDLADSSKYDSEFRLLVKSIYGETVYRKPELGNPPEWVTEEITFPVKKQIEFEEIKNQSNRHVKCQDFSKALDAVSVKIVSFNTNDIQNSDDYYLKYLERYKATIPLRDEYLQLLKISSHIEKSESIIANFFESTVNKCNSKSEAYSEIKHILLHEMFIYTIAFYLKYTMYNEAGYILGKTYFNSSYNNQDVSSFDMFYCENMQSLDEAMQVRDNKNYINGEGALWLEDINMDICTRDELVLADIICFNYSIFSSQKNISAYWFPILYNYGTGYGHNLLQPWAKKLQSKEFVDSVLPLFNFDSIDEFKKRFIEVEKKNANNEYRHFRYSNVYCIAPIICHYIKIDMIGLYR